MTHSPLEEEVRKKEAEVEVDRRESKRPKGGKSTRRKTENIK